MIYFNQVSDYLTCDWRGTLDITKEMEEFKAISMDTDLDPDNNNKYLSLSVHFSLAETWNLYIYSPYWIVNKTDLTFQIRVSWFLNYSQLSISRSCGDYFLQVQITRSAN